MKEDSKCINKIMTAEDHRTNVDTRYEVQREETVIDIIYKQKLQLFDIWIPLLDTDYWRH